MGDYANAAVSIAELAGASGDRAPQLAAGEARRLLALDRLAAWAASPAWPSAVAGEVAGVAEAADAQLGLLALQVGSAQGMLASWKQGSAGWRALSGMRCALLLLLVAAARDGPRCPCPS